jgi:uncharacterized protein (TIGR00290 family)
MQKAIFCWSGGKDSSLALYKVLQQKQFEVCYLLTTISGKHKRVAMHGIREELLDAQAAAIGIPQLKVYTYEPTNEAYEKAMETTLLRAKEEGIEHVLFGDIFLEDLRQYRERNLEKVGMKAVFPLWKQDTGKLIDEFLALGFKTVVCCVNANCLDKQHVGKLLSRAFIKSLPAGVDVCGENGEFHTFCFEGPLFKYPVPVHVKDIVYKPLAATDNSSNAKGFWYSEIVTDDLCVRNVPKHSRP